MAPHKWLKGARWAVLAAMLLAYANSFHNAFHFDDFHTVTDNPAIRSLHNVPRFFTDATTFSVLPSNRTYRPIVSTSLAIDYMLGRGYDVVWFHVGTFLLFLLLVAVLWKLYAQLLNATRPADTGGRNAWLALLAAAWFGLHPAMAETVNYISVAICIARWGVSRRCICTCGEHARRSGRPVGFTLCRWCSLCCPSRLRLCFRCCCSSTSFFSRPKPTLQLGA